MPPPLPPPAKPPGDGALADSEREWSEDDGFSEHTKHLGRLTRALGTSTKTRTLPHGPHPVQENRAVDQFAFEYRRDTLLARRLTATCFCMNTYPCVIYVVVDETVMCREAQLGTGYQNERHASTRTPLVSARHGTTMAAVAYDYCYY